MSETLFLADTEATERLGATLAACCKGGEALYLYGDLGAGKTTFVRGFLRSLGHTGAVKSPTYTLVEPYEAGGRRVYHFDLYRLGDPQELEYMGIRDYLDGEALLLIEWPQQGAGVLPPADLELHLGYHLAGRQIETLAHTEKGAQLLRCLHRSQR